MCDECGGGEVVVALIYLCSSIRVEWEHMETGVRYFAAKNFSLRNNYMIFEHLSGTIAGISYILTLTRK